MRLHEKLSLDGNRQRIIVFKAINTEFGVRQGNLIKIISKMYVKTNLGF